MEQKVLSAEHMYALGVSLGSRLQGGSIVALVGDLGAGKTTLVRGLCSGFGNVPDREVCSPTFSYLNIYKAEKTVYHFDLYRVPSLEDFLAAGFEEYLHTKELCCIEWPQKITSLLPPETLWITLAYAAENERTLRLGASP